MYRGITPQNVTSLERAAIIAEDVQERSIHLSRSAGEISRVHARTKDPRWLPVDGSFEECADSDLPGRESSGNTKE